MKADEEKKKEQSGAEQFKEENKDYRQTEKAAETGEQGRASFTEGTTTQGGSDYGQGSSNLGPHSYQQGSEKTKGSDYKNEAGKLSEERDDIPHGQGAHKNEKESNAQEDYPGLKENDDQQEDQKKSGK